VNGKILSPFAKRRVALAVGMTGLLVFLGLLFMAFAGSGVVKIGGQQVSAVFLDGLNIVPRASEVRISGINKGKVDSVELMDEQRVLVHMTVDDGVRLTSDTRAVLRLKSILGEKYVDLLPGDSSEPLEGVINESLTGVGTDFTTLASGGPGSFDLDNALRGSTVDDTLQRVAEQVPPRSQKLSDQIAELRVQTDNLVANRQSLVNTLDDLASLTTALVDSSDDLGRLMATGNSIQNKLNTAVERAKVNFARIDTAAQVVRAVFDQNEAAIDDSIARYHLIVANVNTAWELFRAGAQVPVSLWGLGPIGYNDLRTEAGPNPFPPFPQYPLPPETAR